MTRLWFGLGEGRNSAQDSAAKSCDTLLADAVHPNAVQCAEFGPKEGPRPVENRCGIQIRIIMVATRSGYAGSTLDDDEGHSRSTATATANHESVLVVARGAADDGSDSWEIPSEAVDGNDDETRIGDGEGSSSEGGSMSPAGTLEVVSQLASECEVEDAASEPPDYCAMITRQPNLNPNDAEAAVEARYGNGVGPITTHIHHNDHHHHSDAFHFHTTHKHAHYRNTDNSHNVHHHHHHKLTIRHVHLYTTHHHNVHHHNYFHYCSGDGQGDSMPPTPRPRQRSFSEPVYRVRIPSPAAIRDQDMEEEEEPVAFEQGAQFEYDHLPDSADDAEREDLEAPPTKVRRTT